MEKVRKCGFTSCGLFSIVDVQGVRDVREQLASIAQHGQGFVLVPLSYEHENRVRSERSQRKPFRHHPFRMDGLQLVAHFQAKDRHMFLHALPNYLQMETAFHRNSRMLGKRTRHRTHCRQH